MNNTAHNILTRCKTALLSKGLSATSRKLYLADIRRFLLSLEESSLTTTRLTNPKTYQDYLRELQSKGLSPAMLSRTLASLKQLGEILSSQHGTDNPCSNLSLSKQGSELPVVRNLALNYIKPFTDYLKANHLSNATIKSYKSDVSRYLLWASKQDIGRDIEGVLTEKNTNKYLKYLSNSSSLAESTRERKDQSLAKFRSWIENNYNPTIVSDNNVSSPSRQLQGPSLTGIRESNSSRARQQAKGWSLSGSNLRTPNPASPRSTIYNLRSILSFVLILLLTSSLAVFGYRQFSRDKVLLTQAYPSSPTTPNRQISFQGRLEDSGGTPITSSTNLVFKLYDADTSGTELYSTGTCAITPDQDGVFSTQIGSDCGSAIGSDVFTENADVWLEVTVAGEILDPRQQIATVAYALNSETLQGFPISATASAVANTVVPMNQWGEIIIGEQSPRMTGVSGTFAISAPAMSITTTTGSSGNITIAPDGTGQVNVNGNTTTTNFFNVSNAQLSTGSLITGTVANNNTGFLLLDLQSGSSPTSVFNVDYAGNIISTGTITLPNSNSLTGVTNYLRLSQGLSVGGADTYYFDSSGNINAASGTFAGTVTLNSVSSVADNNQVLTVDSGVVKYIDTTSWDKDTSDDLSAGNIPWIENSTDGTLYPKNSTLDLLVGGQATSSAKFAVLNIDSGTPTASISGTTSNVASYLAGEGYLGTTNRSSLYLGNASGYDSTGDILLQSNGTGNVGIGTTAPSSIFTVLGGDIVLREDDNGNNAVQISADNTIGAMRVLSNGTVSTYLPGYGDSYFNGTGSVGIGTTAPTQKLQTNGQGFFTSSTASYDPGDSSGAGIRIGYYSSSDFGYINANNTGVAAKSLVLQPNSGNILIGDTANTNSTQGLTINQKANDDQILSLKSSDVAHAMTGITETDTYGSLSKLSADSGGLYLQGLKDADGSAIQALVLHGELGENAGTGKTSGSTGIVEFRSSISDGGTGVTTVNSNGNLFAFRNDASTVGIIDAEGTYHFITGDNDLDILSLSATTGTPTLSWNETADQFNLNKGLNITSGSLTINSNYTFPTSDGTTNYVLSTNGSGTVDWADPAVLAGASVPWIENSTDGTLYPKNSTLDLLIGGQATSSAKFAVLNIDSGTPTATISGTTSNVASYLSGEGYLGTTNRSSLYLGNASGYDTTGDILLQSNGTGNVGIGTTAPESPLHVAVTSNGALLLESTGATQPIYLELRTSNTVWKNQVRSSGNYIVVDDTSSGFKTPFEIEKSTPSNTLYLDSTGYVGIGTTSPGSKLEVSGSDIATGNAIRLSQATPSNFGLDSTGALISVIGGDDTTGQDSGISFRDEQSNWIWTIVNDHSDSNKLKFVKNDGTAFITSTIAGYVGIGTTNPGYLLDIAGTSMHQDTSYFANGTTYYVDGSGNAKFLDLVIADTGNPGLTVGNGTTGYAKIGGSTISDAAGDLTLTSDSGAISLAGDTYIASGLSTFGTAVSDGTIEATKFCTGDGETNCVTDFAAISGGASIWTDGGTYAYLTNGETIGDDTSGVATYKIDGLYLKDSAPLVFGTDNDVTLAYNSASTLDLTGDLDVSGRLAVGPGISIDSEKTLNIGETFTTGSGTNPTSIYSWQTRTEPTISAHTYSTGINSVLLYRITEDTVTPYHGFGRGANNVVYTDGTYTYNYLAGSTNSAYTNSTASSNQDLLYGSLNNAYLNSSGTLTTSIGAGGNSFNSGTGTLNTGYGVYGTTYTNSAGNIGTGYGVRGFVYEGNTGQISLGYGGFFGSTDATTNYGVYGYSNPNDAETFTNAYGGYFDAYSNGASTTLTNAYGVYGSAREVSGNVTTAIAGYFDAPSATTTNIGAYSSVLGAATTNYAFKGEIANGTTDWGIYLNGEDKNYFSGSVGIGTTAPSEKLEVNGISRSTRSGVAGQYIQLDGGDAGSINLTAQSSSGQEKYLIIQNLSGLGTAGSNNGIRFNIGTTAAPSTAVSIDSTGYFGIGDNSPASLFTVGSGDLFQVDSSGDIVKLKNLTYSWPSSHTTDGVLKNDGSGNLTWATLGAAAITADSLDYTEFQDTMDLDANLILNQTGYTWAQDFTGTTADGFTYTANSLTSGDAYTLSSTSTALTTGSLLSLDWSPGSSTTATGDLFTLNIGANGTIGNLLNITDNGSTLFSVSETAVTSNLPTSFTSSGDVAIAYDLNFTNPTASYINSAAPLYIEAGETYNSDDLTLRTYNSGDVVLDSPGGVTLAQAQAWTLATDTSALNLASGLLNLDTTNSRVGIGTTAPTYRLHLSGAETTERILVENTTTGQASIDLKNSSQHYRLITNPGSFMIYDQTDALSRLMIDTNGLVGIGTTAPSAPFHLVGSNGLALFQDNQTDATSKTMRLGVGHYTNSEEPFIAMFANAVSAATNALAIGGGTSLGNAATQISFYTAANATTTTGTEAMRINSSGYVGIGDTSPASLFTVGSGDLFQVDSSGDAVKIKNVTYSWPSSQGGASTVLTNDGSGNLSWGAGGGGSSLWTDGTGYVYPTGGEVLGNPASAGSNKIAGLYLADSAPLVFGTDNNVTYSFNNTTSVLEVTTGTNDINFDSNTLFIDGSADRVGIGTTAPSTKLSIGGASSTISNDSGDITITSADDIILSPTGYVGIGTTAPQNTLTLQEDATTYSSPGIDFLARAGDAIIYDTGRIYSMFDAYAYGQARITIATPTGVGTYVDTLNVKNGMVGIGTTDPNSQLQLNHDTTSITTETDYAFSIKPDTTAELLAGVNTTGGYSFIQSFDPGTAWTTKPLSLMPNGGYVGIGTTAPGALLEVNGGEIWLFDNGNSPRQIIGDNTTSGQYGYLQWDSTNDYYRIETDGTNGLKIKGNNVSIGNLYPSYPLAVGSGSTPLMTVLSSGNVGIGTTNPGYLLEVAGTSQFDSTVNYANGTTYYVDASGNAKFLDLQVADTGNPGLTVGNGSTGYIKVGGSTIYDASSDLILASSNNTVYIGATGADKLDAGTIDPPYTINGEKYATYLSGMTGVKEETTGTIQTTQYVENYGYKATLNFANAEAGSDLWLFRETTQLKKQFSNLVILLSPEKNTRAWYRIDEKSGVAEIYTSVPTRVSYRLTAPRFDSNTWKNTRDSNSTGFILNSPTSWETLPIAELPTFDINNYELRDNQDNYTLTTKAGEKISDFLTAGQALIANIRTGLLEANQVKTQELISPTITTNELKTDSQLTISHNDSTIYDLPSTAVDPTLIVNGELATDTISARVAKLETVEADIVKAKEIVADKITANSIEGLDAKLATLSAGTNQELTDSELETITDRIKARLAEFTQSTVEGLTGSEPTAQDIPAPQEALASQTPSEANGEVGLTYDLPSTIASDSATLVSLSSDMAFINNYLAVVGQATITSLDITGSFYTDSIQAKCAQGSELSGSSEPCSSTLTLQPNGGTIRLAQDTLLIDSSGQVMVNGDLTVSGKILAQSAELGSLNLGTPRDASSSSLGKLLSIYNEQGKEVATIDASGSANLRQLSTELITIASSSDATESASTSALAQALGTSSKTNATAGEATLKTPNTELVIESKYVNEDSLVYLTPTGNTDNKVLFVKSKTTCAQGSELSGSSEPCVPSFTVAIDKPPTSDISFNWWVIQLGGQQ